MSPKPFKPFKRSKKSPFDHDGPSHKALKDALDWIATHDPNAPFSRLIKEVHKPVPPPSEDLPIPTPNESVEPATNSVDAAPPEPATAQPGTAVEPEPESASIPSSPEPTKQEEQTSQEQPGNDATAESPLDEQEANDDEYDPEIAEIASQIRSLRRGPQRPLINSRRIRRSDDDDPSNLSRHRRCCVVCHHDDKYAIEQAFLEWRRPNDIKSEFQLPTRMCLYRHARATGLFEKRARNLRSGLEKVIEESTCRPPSADSIIRAVRVYGCLDANGRWVEPPRQLIITHQTVPRPSGALPAGAEVALQPRSEQSPVPAPKKLINVDPTVLEIEKGA